ncbi:hypothetical protein Tco_1250416 [Tanacetum coccineum]
MSRKDKRPQKEKIARESLKSSKVVHHHLLVFRCTREFKAEYKRPIEVYPNMSQIIRSGSAPFASLSVQQESSKQNIMAVAALYFVADNTDALSLSRSQVIPRVGGSGPLASSVHQESV